MTRTFAIALILSASIAAPRSALAQPQKPALPATAKAAAQESYAKGQRLFNRAEQKKDPALYEQAYLQFAQAYAIYPDDKVIWNLAVSEMMTKRYLEALRHFREYDAHQHVLSSPSHKDRADLVDWMAQATKALGHLDIDAPVGARVLLDDNEIGTMPMSTVDVTAGPHVVVVILPDTKRLHREVNAPAGTNVAVHFIVDAPPPAPPAPAPVEPPPPAIPGDRERPVAPEQSSSFWTTRRYIGLAVAGVGAGALGGSFYFAAQSNDAADRLNALEARVGTGGCTSTPSQACADLRDAHDSIDRNHTLSIVFGAIGLTAIAAGVVMIVWPQSGSTTASTPRSSFNPRQTAISPLFSPSGGGLLIHGAF